MRTFKQILIKIAWLIIYTLFNIGLFFIELNFFFKKKPKTNKSNSGIETLDVLIDVGHFFLDALNSFAIFIHASIDLSIALVAFLLFIPVQLRYIKPNYKRGSKKKFLYSVLASFVVLMLLKLIMYIWMFIDTSYT